jgi:hypothetical protein
MREGSVESWGSARKKWPQQFTASFVHNEKRYSITRSRPVIAEEN